MIRLLAYRPFMSRLLLFATALTVCVCSTYAAYSQPIHLRYGQAYSAQRSIFALPMLLAERRGFFLREGLDFHIVPVPGGGTRRIAALHAATAHISHVATPFLVQAAMGGSDAVAVVTEFNNPIYSLVANPENKAYAHLKGKLIGLAAETGSIPISIRNLLAMHGVQRDDFRARFVDGTPDRLVCLTKGDCDAVPLGQPTGFLARHTGLCL